jgi:hypothetical protein
MVVSPRALLLAGIALAMLAGCATGGYSKVESGVVAAGKMRVTLGSGWQRAPYGEVPERKAVSKVLSRGDIETNRLILIPNVDVGESLFREVSDTRPPVREAGATEDEIANFIAASLRAALWEGEADVAASNVTPHGFVGIPGVLFELEADVPGAANLRGTAGALVHEEKLYVTIFLAQSPGAWERYREDAQAIVESMVVSVKTIGFN